MEETSRGQLQLIEIVDDQRHILNVQEISQFRRIYDCAGSVLMPSVYAHDECGTVLDYKIDYPYGLLQENGGILNWS